MERRKEVLEVLRFHHASLQESMSKEIIVILFSGGRCGETILEANLRKQKIPCLQFHNMDEFYVKYCASLFPKSNKMTLDDLMDVLREEYKRILVIDIYRDSLSRRIESFFSRMISNLQQFVWALPQTLLYEKWDQCSFSEKQEIFERIIFHWIEQREGIDSECPYLFSSRDRCDLFDMEKKYLFAVHPFKSNVFFLKLRFQDWLLWDSILAYYLQLPSPWITWNHENEKENEKEKRFFDAPYCPFEKMKPRERGFFYEFLLYYRPSLLIKTQLLQQKTFLRYLTKDEQNYILQHGYSYSFPNILTICTNPQEKKSNGENGDKGKLVSSDASVSSSVLIVGD